LPGNSEPTIDEKLLPEVLAAGAADAGAGAAAGGGLVLGFDAAGFGAGAAFAGVAIFGAAVLRVALRFAELFAIVLRADVFALRAADLRPPARFFIIFDFFAAPLLRLAFLPPLAALDFAAFAMMSSAPCAIP
jgi:hypothetical protein